MTRERLLLLLLVVGVGAGAAGSYAWWSAEDEAPAAVVAVDRGDRPERAAADRRPRREPGTRERKARPVARREKSAKEPALQPGERAEARLEYRDERVLDVNERLDAYATKAGWDDDVTEE